jgi:hypothetical protein
LAFDRSGLATGHLSVPALLIIQILNPLCVILVPWMFEKSVTRSARAADA